MSAAQDPKQPLAQSGEIREILENLEMYIAIQTLIIIHAIIYCIFNTIKTESFILCGIMFHLVFEKIHEIRLLFFNKKLLPAPPQIFKYRKNDLYPLHSYANIFLHQKKFDQKNILVQFCGPEFCDLSFGMGLRLPGSQDHSKNLK